MTFRPDDAVELSAYGRHAHCEAAPLDEDALGPDMARGSTQESTTRHVSSCGWMGRQSTFTWRAPRDGAYTFDTHGSDFDTVLEVLSETCGSDSLGCNDDTDGLRSEVTVELEAGQLITLVVGGFRAASGEFVLNGQVAEVVQE